MIALFYRQSMKFDIAKKWHIENILWIFGLQAPANRTIVDYWIAGACMSSRFNSCFYDRFFRIFEFSIFYAVFLCFGFLLIKISFLWSERKQTHFESRINIFFCVNKHLHGKIANWTNNKTQSQRFTKSHFCCCWNATSHWTALHL